MNKRWKKYKLAAALLIGGIVALQIGEFYAFAEPMESTSQNESIVEIGPGTGLDASSQNQDTIFYQGSSDGPGFDLNNGNTGAVEEAPVENSKAKYLNTVVDSAGISIYVSKKNKKVTLYRNGVVMNIWDCNLGTNSLLGDKQKEGDRITPSGKFYICLRNPYSKCHLSLGLSYPSDEDADRGFNDGLITAEQRDKIKTAISNRQAPPWNTALGGEIMLHGGYMPDASTRGCVALPNDVMDYLWKFAGLGVPVEIGP